MLDNNNYRDRREVQDRGTRVLGIIVCTRFEPSFKTMAVFFTVSARPLEKFQV